MDDDLARRIASHSQYQELKARRTRVGWVLTVLVLIVYYGFVLLVAFNKPAARPATRAEHASAAGGELSLGGRVSSGAFMPWLLDGPPSSPASGGESLR